MKIGICVHYTESWIDLANMTTDVLYKYCAKHGYNRYVYETAYSQYTGIDKILQLQEYLIFKDAIMVMDADTLIMNHTIKIEDLIDEEHDLFITKDYNGLNAGVFIIKNTEWAFEFLHYILNEIGKPNIHCEQDAINQYIKEHGADKIKFLPQYKINSYIYSLYPEIPMQVHHRGNFEIGDFILHVPGLPLEKKIQILNSQLPNIIYE